MIKSSKITSQLLNDSLTTIRWISFFPIAMGTCVYLLDLFEKAFSFNVTDSWIFYLLPVFVYCISGFIFILTGAVVAPNSKIIAARILLAISFLIGGIAFLENAIDKEYFTSIVLLSFLTGSFTGYFAIKKLFKK